MIAKGCWLEWEQDHCWVYQSSATGLRRVAGYPHDSQPELSSQSLELFLPKLRSQLGLATQTQRLHVALPAHHFEVLVVRVPAFPRPGAIGAYLKAVLGTELKVPLHHYSWRQWQYASLGNGESLWVLLGAPVRVLKQMTQVALVYDFVLKGVYPTHLLEWLQSALLLGMKEGCQAVVVARYKKEASSHQGHAHSPKATYVPVAIPLTHTGCGESSNDLLWPNTLPWAKGQMGYLERLAQNPLPRHWQYMNTLEATPWWWRVSYATYTTKGLRRWAKGYIFLGCLALFATLLHQHWREKAHVQQVRWLGYQQHLRNLGEQHRRRSSLDATLRGIQSWQTQRTACLQYLRQIQTVLAAVPAVWLSALEWAPGEAVSHLGLSFVEPSLGDLAAQSPHGGAAQCAQVAQKLGIHYQVNLKAPQERVPAAPLPAMPLPAEVHLSLKPLP